MRLGFFAALVAIASVGFGATPDPSYWYTPTGGFENYTQSASWTDPRGGQHYCEVDSYGQVNWFGDPPNDAATKAAIESALKSWVQSDMNSTAIETIGERLTELLDKSELKVTSASDDSRSYTLTFGGKTLGQIVADGSKEIELKSTGGFFGDNKSLTHTGEGNAVELAGFKDANPTESVWATAGWAIPIKDMEGNLSWRHWTGWCSQSLDNMGGEENSSLEIKGWKAKTPTTQYSLGDVLAGEDPADEARQNDCIITRSSASGSGDGTLNYVRIGSLTNASVKVDGDYITRNTDGELTLYGVANESRNNVLPVKNSGHLAWLPLPTVDNASLKNKTDWLWELNGYSLAGVDTVPVKTASGISWKDYDSATTDEKSINRNTTTAGDVLQLRGFANAATGTMPYKGSGGTLQWKNAGALSYDGVSITTNYYGDIQIAGYNRAPNSAVPVKTASGIEWLRSSSATNLFLAGAGINITHNGAGVCTISAQRMEDEDAQLTIDVITAVRYDEDEHKFYATKQSIVVNGRVSGDEREEEIFTAVSHSSQHEDPTQEE